MYKHALTIILICLNLCTYATVENLNYDIILWNTKVGKMNITRESKPDGTDVYTLVTSSRAKFLWLDKSNDSKYTLVYKAGKLVSSVFKEIENGAVKRWCNITWDGTKYQVDSYKGKRTFTQPAGYSTITAYFQGLTKVEKIFYESEGDFATTEYPEPNTMEFKTSDGHKSVYHYVNGRLNNMEFKISIATIYMVLSK